ncbi:MAG TPA: PstS family phosphate ABC transporter substrate-binding protein [Longimicrobiales bacterium]|nr:PstS family phosphate ABC transporter substrate-binding protein [Longimicrobiales bacterium]
MATQLKKMAAFALVAAFGCGGGDKAASGDLSGSISVDGSSTVYPITEAMAEEFGIEHEGAVRVTVGLSGTGGGFKRFCAGETDISNASRTIKDSEKQLCAQNNVTFAEIPVAYDGLSVIVNPQNNFAQCLTVAELKKVWAPGSTVRRWSDVRQGFPNTEMKLYGPGTNSGTFDYFTEEVTGEAGASRADYTASEDDNVLVQGVEGDANSLGYFGFAYYKENAQRLKLVAVDGGSGCVTPSEETIKNGSYKPLSRPLYIYVSHTALQRPEVKAFVEFYITHAPELVSQVGYVPLEASQYQEQSSKLGQTTTTP